MKTIASTVTAVVMHASSVALFLILPACGRLAPAGLDGSDVDAAVSPTKLDAGAMPVMPEASLPGISRNGWTWSNVGPQANDLFGVWGSGPYDVWFSGSAGTILHWDGHAFSAPDSGSAADLRGLWGSGPDDVWAVGYPLLNQTVAPSDVLHWNGSAWSLSKAVMGAQLSAVGGSGPRDVWAVGYTTGSTGPQGIILHWDGTSWSPSATPSRVGALNGVWSSSSTDAWAVGSVDAFAGGPRDFTILHWDGTTWSAVNAPSASVGAMAGVWGTGPDDVWFVGEAQVDMTQPGDDPSGTLTHWSGGGGGWSTPHVLSSYATPLFAIAGSSPSEAKAVGSAGAVQTWNGSAWSSGQVLPGDYRAIWESGPSDTWAVGLGGVMAHWNGTTWTQLTPPPPPYGYYVAAGIWANSPTDAWAVANGDVSASVLRWNGNTWAPSILSSTAPGYAYFYGIWGTGPNDMWAAGANGSGGSGPSEPNTKARVVHWQGTSWSLAYELASEIEFKAVWGSAFSNVWAVGIDNVVAHFDGSGWSTVSFAPTEQVFAMGGSGPSDLWAATSDNGSGVTLQHWDGSRWSVSYTGTGLPMAIWAWGPNDAWATGWYGMGVLQWNGTSWSNTDAPTDYDFGAIWGSGPSDVWAVGSSGAVVHFDGSTWSSDSVTTSDLVGVAGSGPNDVWMLTAAGAILHHP